jgi:hypothetical protein
MPVAVARTDHLATRALPWLLGLFMSASLLHFSHNAQYLSEYPNLPIWLSRVAVYNTWCVLTGVGALGYALYRLEYRRVGIGILALYATTGFDGFLHYTRAPLSHHTATMNVTIWTEAIAAALLLAGIIRAAIDLTSYVTPNNA